MTVDDETVECMIQWVNVIKLVPISHTNGVQRTDQQCVIEKKHAFQSDRRGATYEWPPPVPRLHFLRPPAQLTSQTTQVTRLQTTTQPGHSNIQHTGHSQDIQVPVCLFDVVLSKNTIEWMLLERFEFVHLPNKLSYIVNYVVAWASSQKTFILDSLSQYWKKAI